MLLAGLTLRYRSIWPAIFFHTLLDTTQFWNGGGVRGVIETTLDTLSPIRLAAGIAVAIALFGGWGTLLVALEARRRSRASSA